ncbi:MAG: Type 2 DNA topoisomerase 6 subunit B [Phycisphaerae bacterium]|nr:Type 2 DNA topoisomerase 6 subunit B [Phycisphaerae bacterium]
MAAKKKQSQPAATDQLQLTFNSTAGTLKKKRTDDSPEPSSHPEAQSVAASQKTPDSTPDETSAARPTRKRTKAATAESMAAAQREISISEFFAKNRHLLGFDNKRKALLTAVKEAVDNSLDACEEAHILPEIQITIAQQDEDRFRITVRDNGPGIVKNQIPNIFGKLLYGSKFHRLRMSRGQQGIGISAAGLYGLLTTGRPIQITSRLPKKKEAHHYQLQIDTKKNKPDIVKEDIVPVDWANGTEVTIDLLASYIKGRQSVDEYLLQTAIANPHCTIIYKSSQDPQVEYRRTVNQLPLIPDEIKPHPHGVELGTMIKMLDDTAAKFLGGFLQSEFCRVSPGLCQQVCKQAGLSAKTSIKQLDGTKIEKIYKALQQAKLMAPPTNCLAPIGAEQILSGLLQGVKAEFYTASTRPPAVYRGNPFQVEVGLAYGGELGPSPTDISFGNETAAPPAARVIRFANRVPLLYQQSACCMFKSVLDINWSNYSISQSRGALPSAPLLIMIHLASVWVPFTSEAKEAIADYDEIRKEIRLALQECARRLGLLLSRKKRSQAFARRRDVFTRYIDELVSSTVAIARINRESLRNNLLKIAQRHTRVADQQYDEHGKLIEQDQADTPLANTIVVKPTTAPDTSNVSLFESDATTTEPSKKRRARKKIRTLS